MLKMFDALQMLTTVYIYNFKRDLKHIFSQFLGK